MVLRHVLYNVVSIPYRLATNEYEEKDSELGICLFQFLIGWLQTEHTSQPIFCVCMVSIPYRLATNI